jgi:putative transposase
MYHVVFCPKYRRPVLVEGIDKRLKQIVREVVTETQSDLIELQVMPDHVQLLMEIDPQFGVHKLIKLVKGRTSRFLRQEFPRLRSRLPTLRTNRYFVSTVGGSPMAVAKQYLENQKWVLSMAMHRKVFWSRVRPTPDQKGDLRRLAGSRRWLWNWALGRRKAYYAETGNTIPAAQLSAELTALKQQPETAWLQEADSQALQQALKDLDRAFRNFFAKRARFPRFKSKRRDPLRFRIPQRVQVAEGAVIIPKVGKVRIRQSRLVDLPTKSASFRRDGARRWFVSLTAAFEMPDVPIPPPEPALVLGLELGLKDFVVFSDDRDPIPLPKFYRKAQRTLRRAQKAVSRRRDGSKRQRKARAAVARIHARTAEKRADFLHQLTTALVRDHDGLCIEDLSLKGLVRTKLAKSLSDAACGEFRRQLEYKSLWNRKPLAVIGRFFPSTQTCHACGRVNDALTLKDRVWVCEGGVEHDRDFNAAKNINDEGLRILEVGDTESRNARGRPVRPAKAG